MKTVLITIIVVFVLAISCNRTKQTSETTVLTAALDTVINTNLNIIISPDLSNRISSKYPKPVKDIEIIEGVLDLYYPTIYKSGGRAFGQEDKISILITNPQLMNTYVIDDEPLKIDLKDFSNDERIRYFTDSLANRTFESDKKKMVNEIDRVYKSAIQNTVGADIYDLFKSRLSSDIVLKDDNSKKSFDHIIIEEKRNILILLTDGYIEAGLYGEPAKNKQYYYLDNDIIRSFRNEYNSSGETDMKTFFKNNGYGIVPVSNPALQNLEVFAVEFYDRSLSREGGNNTVLPDDYDILKVFWEDWMKKSGVKKFKMYERFATVSDFEVALKNFILTEN